MRSRASNAPKPPAPASASAAGTRLAVLVASAALFFAVLTAWHNSFSVPLLLDDTFAITANSSIQRLWPLGPVLKPPAHATTVGRPLLNLSFAVNYAFNGPRVQGYHAFSVIAHVLAGITLMGVVRRTLLLPQFRARLGKVALPLAFFVALLWLLHPLQTESITYISQRAEAMMGLCYFLTLYGLIRGATSPKAWRGYGLAIAACAAGMGTKEGMVTAPAVVFLFDRVFLAGTFKAVWQQRRWFYCGLAATWLILVFCMVFLHGEYHGIGYIGKYTWWTYALTESRVVVHYLKLTLWPRPLVFDYGPEMIITRVGEALPYLLFLGLLLAALAWSWRRWPSWVFLGLWFFIILSPTSSVVPVVLQPMAENRVYLPLVAVVVAAVVGLYLRIGTKSLVVFPLLAVGLGALTVHRNRDYRDEITLWSDTVAKRPQNARAYVNLGNALGDKRDRTEEAIAAYEAALRLNPDSDEAHNNLGNVLMNIPGRQAEALPHYEAMVRLNPRMAEAHFNLANALMQFPGRTGEALAHYEKAAEIKPDFADLQEKLGMLLSEVPGRAAEAAQHYENALARKPEAWVTHFNLANVLVSLPDRKAEAVAHYEAAIRIKPDFVWAHFNLAVLLSNLPGRKTEALAQIETTLRMQPNLEHGAEMLARIKALPEDPR